MNTKIQEETRHFNAYYSDDSILVQFIIEDFIQAHLLIAQIRDLIQINMHLPQVSTALFPSLIQILEQLIGSSSYQRHSVHSYWANGALTKLKEHCEQFSLNSSHQNKRYLSLHLSTYYAWSMAIDNLAYLKSLDSSSQPNPSFSQDSNSIKRSFEQFQKRFNQITRTIPLILKGYWNNENVLYCVLRKKEIFAEIFGKEFLSKKLKVTKEKSDLVKFLVQRYQVRGFENILPAIERLFDQEPLEQNR